MSLNKLEHALIEIYRNGGSIKINELKNIGIETKGNDVSIFLRRAKLAEKINRGTIKLTKIGYKIAELLKENKRTYAYMMLHIHLYMNLPHYRVILNIIRDNPNISKNQIENLTTQTTIKMGFKGGMNRNAINIVLSLLRDLNVIAKHGNTYSVKPSSEIFSKFLEQVLINKKLLDAEELYVKLKELLGELNVNRYVKDLDRIVHSRGLNYIVAPTLNIPPEKAIIRLKSMEDAYFVLFEILYLTISRMVSSS